MSHPPSSIIGSLADLMEGLGRVPLERVRLRPAPGTATEADVLVRHDGVKRLCELVDGVLVEKAVGFWESRLAAVLIGFLEEFLRSRDLGIVLGADAALRLAPGLVRLPDVAFISWERFPGRELPSDPIPDIAPDLAVEVMSPRDTKAEMDRKVREYFDAGARLAWILDPSRRSAAIHAAPGDTTGIGEDGVLEGGEVLPGFRLSLRDWFSAAGDRRPS